MATRTRFQKKSAAGGGKLPNIAGTKASLFNYQVLTSTGAPSLDQVIGGGLPLGTVLLLQDLPHPKKAETVGGRYTTSLLKYFLAEGIYHRHGVFTASQTNPDLITSVPAIVEEAKVVPKTQDDGEKMTIAWRYEKQPKLLNHDDKSSNNSAKHHFNNNKTIDQDRLKLCSHESWQPNDDDTNNYEQVFKRLNQTVQQGDYGLSSSCDNILRVGIQDVASVLWTSVEDVDAVQLLLFLSSLKSLARQHLLVITLTLSPDFFKHHELNGLIHGRVKELADYVIDICPFGKEERKSGPFKDYHGLLRLEKATAFNALTLNTNVDLHSKYLFKSLRTKFSIEKMHLPPDMGVDQDAVVRVAEKMSKIEF